MEDFLEKYKKEYIKTSPTPYLKTDGWYEVSQKLSSQTKYVPTQLFAKGLMFAAVILAVPLSAIGTAQAVKPGAALYPLKLFSDNLISKVTGNYEAKIEKRTQDIIDVSQNQDDSFEKATNSYTKTLDETKEQAQKSQTEEKFKQTLDKQEQKLKDAQQKNPSAQEKLQEVIEKTQEIKGEVKGQNTNGNSQKGKSQNQDNKGQGKKK